MNGLILYEKELKAPRTRAEILQVLQGEEVQEEVHQPTLQIENFKRVLNPKRYSSSQLDPLFLLLLCCRNTNLP